MIVRATFAAPPGAGYTVDQMRTGGTSITYGGQIADHVQMILTGVAKRRGFQGEVQPCTGIACEHPAKPGVVAVVAPDADCAAVDWDARAPLLAEPPPSAGSEKSANSRLLAQRRVAIRSL